MSGTPGHTAQHAAPGSPLAGLGYMVAASTSFALMNTLAAHLGRQGMPWQATGASRAMLGLLAALALARARGVSLVVRDRGTLWVRCLAGTAGMLGTFYVLRHMPLADAAALLNTVPLWIALLAWYELGEAPSPLLWTALLLALCAIVLLERPGNLHFGTGLVALLAALCSAFAMVSLRRLGNEAPEAVVVYFTAFAALAFAVLLAVQWRAHPLVMPGAQAWVELVLLGISATVGQLALTRAYALDRAARVGAAGWLQVLLNLCADWLLLARPPPLATLLGVLVLLCAGALLVWDALRASRR